MIDDVKHGDPAAGLVPRPAAGAGRVPAHTTIEVSNKKETQYTTNHHKRDHAMLHPAVSASRGQVHPRKTHAMYPYAYSSIITCPDCNGQTLTFYRNEAGNINSHPCSTCDQHGIVLEVQAPTGWPADIRVYTSAQLQQEPDTDEVRRFDPLDEWEWNG